MLNRVPTVRNRGALSQNDAIVRVRRVDVVLFRENSSGRFRCQTKVLPCIVSPRETSVGTVSRRGRLARTFWDEYGSSKLGRYLFSVHPRQDNIDPSDVAPAVTYQRVCSDSVWEPPASMMVALALLPPLIKLGRPAGLAPYLERVPPGHVPCRRRRRDCARSRRW